MLFYFADIIFSQIEVLTGDTNYTNAEELNDSASDELGNFTGYKYMYVCHRLRDGESTISMPRTDSSAQPYSWVDYVSEGQRMTP